MAPVDGDSTVLDVIDRAILGLLRSRGRLSFRELGDEIGLGATATADRVRRLERLGVITGYRAEVDPAALGVGLTSIVELKLRSDTDEEAFEEMLATTPEVTRAAHVTGAYDYVLTLACPDVATLDRILRGWKRDRLVLESSTRIVLTEITVD